MAELYPLAQWSGPPAVLTLWQPTLAAQACAQRAPASAVPPSYEQEQHLRAFQACAARGERMARLIIVVWEQPGKCDLRVMSHVLNAHLLRHDTYHSRFAAEGEGLRRHVLPDVPRVLVEPVTRGEVDAATWRNEVEATPTPFNWDCFRFGILQRAGGFTFFASVDHLHADSSLIAMLMTEVHAAYGVLIDGAPLPRHETAGRYLDYCLTQRRRSADLTLASPGVTAWVDYLERNGGRMPPFCLPWGISDDRCRAEHINVEILTPLEMASFEAVCHAAGARVIGGVFAAAARAEQALCGQARYSVVTATTTRHSPEAFRMAGWCMGVVPVELDTAAGSFAACARAAQQCFDANLPLAAIPIERVLELAVSQPAIRPVATGGVMLSYMDVNMPPLSAHIAGAWHAAQGRVYINEGMAAQVALWFFRTQRGLSLTVGYPANATAAQSVQRYIAALKSAFAQIAAGT